MTTRDPRASRDPGPPGIPSDNQQSLPDPADWRCHLFPSTVNYRWDSLAADESGNCLVPNAFQSLTCDANRPEKGGAVACVVSSAFSPSLSEPRPLLRCRPVGKILPSNSLEQTDRRTPMPSSPGGFLCFQPCYLYFSSHGRIIQVQGLVGSACADPGMPALGRIRAVPSRLSSGPPALCSTSSRRYMAGYRRSA